MKRSHLLLVGAAVALYLYSKRSAGAGLFSNPQTGFAAGAPVPMDMGASHMAAEAANPNDPFRFMY